MDALFINKIKHTKSTYIEMNKKYLFKQIFVIRLLVSIFFCIMEFIFWYLYDMIAMSVFLIVFTVVFCLIPEIRIRMYAKNNIKQMLTLYGEIPDVKISFFEENIITENSSNKGELNLDYGKIVKVFQSENLYLLQLDNKIFICVDKNRFEKGTCKEFEKFITQKAFNAKIKL